ncbi:MAG: D-aminoacyl-tRNA deacylase [Thermodesulfobacteriota bacterium]
MRAVIQRVKRARVEVNGRVSGDIGPGLLVFLGVERRDTEKDCDYVANKTAHLRVFPDEEGMMNRSVVEAGGSVLVVSQFTLWGDCRKGRRPSFIRAASPDEARGLYERVVDLVRGKGLRVETGEFQEMMDVHIVNDGPITLLIDSGKEF